MGIARWFRNQKIQSKLIWINVLVVAMALAPTLVLLLSYEYYAARKATLQEIRIQAAIVSDNAAAALAFQDAIAASDALATLTSSPDMLRAFLVLPDDSLLAVYRRTDIPASDVHSVKAVTVTNEWLTWSKFTLSQPVYLKSEYVGSLVLEVSLDSLYRRIQLYVLVVALVSLVNIMLSLWLAIKLKDSITKPLALLMGSVNSIRQQQDYTVRPVIDCPDEIGDLSRAFHGMMNNLEERDKRLQDLAFYDSVTGLPNRHFFQERIAQAVANAERYNTRCSLIFIDLDDFKIVNDTLGHDVGDALLEVIGQRLRKLLRRNDLVCRIGGDEFAVILENIADDQVPVMLALKIIATISELISLTGNDIYVGASLGISIFPDHATTTTDLLKTADTAMYVAKGHTKNTYHVYTAES